MLKINPYVSKPENELFESLKDNFLATILGHLNLLRKEESTHFAHVSKPAEEFGDDLDVLITI